MVQEVLKSIQVRVGQAIGIPSCENAITVVVQVKDESPEAMEKLVANTAVSCYRGLINNYKSRNKND